MFQLHFCDDQFYWQRKPEYQEKIAELSQTLSHKVVLSKPHNWWEL